MHPPYRRPSHNQCHGGDHAIVVKHHSLRPACLRQRDLPQLEGHREVGQAHERDVCCRGWVELGTGWQRRVCDPGALHRSRSPLQ
eukprot:1249-Eustigmatos_ZCMA.PRE.1